MTGVTATLLLVPLAATGSLDGLDIFAVALVALPLAAALIVRGKDEAREEPLPHEDRDEPPLRWPPL